MQFCPKCGSLMRPKSGAMACPKCGHTTTAKGESVVVRSQAKTSEVAVIEEKGAGLPLDESEVCPDCGEYGAYYYERQTRAADEATTRFYICSHCDHRWRDYQ